MKRSRIIGSILGVATIALTIAWAYFALVNAPSWNGVSLSEWLERFAVAKTFNEKDEAADAIQSIGADAVPSIIADLGREENDFKRWLRTVAPKSWHWRLRISDSEERSGNAIQLSQRLGTNTFEALPLLIEAVQTDTNVRVRLGAALMIRGIGSPAVSAIPSLIELLNDPDESVRITAAFCLGKFVEQEEIIVPALIAYIESAKDNGNKHELITGSDSLMQIDAETGSQILGIEMSNPNDENNPSEFPFPGPSFRK